MERNDISTMRTNLSRFLRRFQSCGQDKNTRNYFRLYTSGLMSELPRKNCEAIALQAGVPVRSMQWFLARQVWDHEWMRNKIQQIVADEHRGKHQIGIIDETSFVKKGDKTPGVQHQYCGTVGKQENCIVTVHLTYAVDNFHTLIDQDLFLPKSWDEDRERCRAAGIPDKVVYRPKWEIAIEQHDRATSNGITFDEDYGGHLPCRRLSYRSLPKTAHAVAGVDERNNVKRTILRRSNCVPSLKDIELSRGSRFGFSTIFFILGRKAPSNLRASLFCCFFSTHHLIR